ncbi:hypothetical protein ACQJBY_008131 [Aegilops geniculata]
MPPPNAPSSSCGAALALLSLWSPSRLLAAVAAKEPELGSDGSEGSVGAGSGSGGAAAVSTRQEPARSAPRASQVRPPPPPATVASPALYRRGSSHHLPQQWRPHPAPPLLLLLRAFASLPIPAAARGGLDPPPSGSLRSHTLRVRPLDSFSRGLARSDARRACWTGDRYRTCD